MKTPNRQEPQQITFNHLSDIGFRDFMSLYKKCTAKPYSFLVADASFATDNLLKKLWESKQKPLKNSSWKQIKANGKLNGII